MKMNKTVKWILIAVLVIAVLATIIYLITNWGKTDENTPPQGGPNPVGTGIAGLLTGLFSSDWIKNLFGGSKDEMATPACQNTNPGFDNNGYYTRACGGVPGGGGANCNPDSPGKDMFGFNSTQCGA